jgi:hypothetical protein
MVVTPSEIVTLVRALQPEKAEEPMLATLAGIDTLVSA